MANMFDLILIIVTIVTGLLWCSNKFFLALKRRKYQVAAVSSTTGAQINNEVLKQDYSKLRWLETGISIFPILAIVLIVRLFIYEPFLIPSGSMIPTLLIGDFILVEKFTYGIKDPIYLKTLIKVGHPKRGDVVVFKYPGNVHLDYIKRIVGIPGDRVTYDSIAKKVTIQTRCSSNTNCSDTVPIVYSDIRPSNFVQTFSDSDEEITTTSGFFQTPKEKNIKKVVRLIECKEKIGDTTHSILTLPIAHDYLNMYYQQQNQRLSTWVVPPGLYFMMGDNRDNSSDSRYWGFVPEANLVGKATVVWMSFQKKEGEWPTAVRLKHIGIIH